MWEFDPGTAPITLQEVKRLKPFEHFVGLQKRVFNRRRLSFASLYRILIAYVRFKDL